MKKFTHFENKRGGYMKKWAKYMNAEKITQNISNEVGERAKYTNTEKNSPQHIRRLQIVG
jgi:hypothetical protein